jgi:hypothetical protein
MPMTAVPSTIFLITATPFVVRRLFGVSSFQ